ncbi:hypothetical protein [Cesiribacter andamanensis]|uniref:ABC transporter permease n=1 Tax=Cesiribacter andamanensis AMV16 TaxID=1279009 RepID=M7N1Y9_9BACT|nr:hypothetical protein [Cesiribacter andamanensis]EMR01231.1 hypothetical protein ADICEAN_03640 [Cesiribacter andamanensis AMV16]
MHSSLYNPNRQLHFVLRQATLFRNRWAIAAAALLGALLLITLATAYFKPEALPQVQGWYQLAFWLVGLIFTSQIFMELHAPNQAYAYLTLPVSTLEKLLGSWLLTSPIYVLGFTAVTYVIYFLGILVTGFEVSPLTYFDNDFLNSIGTYMVIQTLYLWGAAYFRKTNFLKTVLVQIILMLLIGMWAGALIYMIYGGTFEAEHQNASPAPFMENVFVPAMKVLFWGVLGPYMLLVTYFTLKERQL